MIVPSIQFRTSELTILKRFDQLPSRLYIAKENSLTLMLHTLRRNCPVGWRPAREAHPGEPRMKNAIFSKREDRPNVYGGRVYIDTNICPHAYYYTYGRAGGRMIFPVRKKALTIVKKGMTKATAPLRKWARLGGMRPHTEYLEKTVREVESKIREYFKDAVRVWIGGV